MNIVNSLASQVGTPIHAPHAPSNVFLKEAQTQWFKRPADQRYQSLGDMMDAVAARRKASRSFKSKLSDLEVVATDDTNLLVQSRVTGSRVAPSHWAFGQFNQKVGAPAAYLRSLPAPLAAQNLNYTLGKAADESVKLLTIERDSGTDILQAATGPDYGRIWDLEVLQQVQRIVEVSGGKFFNPKDWSGKPSGLYASDHDIFCYMIDGGSIVDGGTERDQLHRGFFISNSETGAKALWLKTFLFRQTCGNHLVWHAEDITEYVLRHTQNAPARFGNEAAPKLLEFVHSSAKPMEDTIRRARSYALPLTPGEKGADSIIEFGRKHNFTRPEIRGAYAAACEEEGQCASLWDFVNGLTAHARGYDFVDSRVDLESRAGKLLDIVGN